MTLAEVMFLIVNVHNTVHFDVGAVCWNG